MTERRNGWSPPPNALDQNGRDFDVLNLCKPKFQPPEGAGSQRHCWWRPHPLLARNSPKGGLHHPAFFLDPGFRRLPEENMHFQIWFNKTLKQQPPAIQREPWLQPTTNISLKDVLDEETKTQIPNPTQQLSIALKTLQYQSAINGAGVNRNGPKVAQRTAICGEKQGEKPPQWLLLLRNPWQLSSLPVWNVPISHEQWLVFMFGSFWGPRNTHLRVGGSFKMAGGFYSTSSFVFH